VIDREMQAFSSGARVLFRHGSSRLARTFTHLRVTGAFRNIGEARDEVYDSALRPVTIILVAIPWSYTKPQ